MTIPNSPLHPTLQVVGLSFQIKHFTPMTGFAKDESAQMVQETFLWCSFSVLALKKMFKQLLDSENKSKMNAHDENLLILINR